MKTSRFTHSPILPSPPTASFGKKGTNRGARRAVTGYQVRHHGLTREESGSLVILARGLPPGIVDYAPECALPHAECTEVDFCKLTVEADHERA